MSRQSLGAPEWAALIDRWRESGLSLPAFCQQHGLRRGTMQNWVYKPTLKRAIEAARRAGEVGVEASALQSIPSPAFLPVRLAGTDSPSHPPVDLAAIEVVLSRGRRVAVGPGFDPETLRRVVAALES
jgi:hypothetical protein